MGMWMGHFSKPFLSIALVVARGHFIKLLGISLVEGVQDRKPTYCWKNCMVAGGFKEQLLQIILIGGHRPFKCYQHSQI